MKIDAHQHFWHYTPAEFPWIGPRMEVLKRDCLPADLLPLLKANGIDGTVAVQARQSLHETRWLLESADANPFIRGVVGWVDLRSPEVSAQLEEFSPHPKFRGVRHIVHDEPDDDFMLREDFLRGVGTLASFNLVYDILIFHRHLPVARTMVERFPDQRFVVDHIAKPAIREGRTDPWAADLRRLAAFPNVVCKVSGMNTEADWKRWKREDFRPYLDSVFDAFGPPRIMYGSDWPVCTVAGSYADAAGIVSDYVGRLSRDEQEAVWGGTARRVYGMS